MGWNVLEKTKTVADTDRDTQFPKHNMHSHEITRENGKKRK